MKQALKKAAIAGIIVEALYFLSVTLFLATKADLALTIWESMTVVGAFAILIALSIFAEGYRIKPMYRSFMLISLSGTLILTSAAHFTSIGVVRQLIAQGISVPDYFRIGFFPSLEMTVDYTAWGLFIGCAFLAFLLGIKDKTLSILSAVCSALCFTGFIGSFFSESLWYFAPMGYGLGFLIMCIAVIKKGAPTTDPKAE